ncbi:hypothetical protein [Glycomyces sp. YM15]|uniref:hypothetical protein n=1 Tax=Glycomyces sp. YM15 TaxID=2800446 RepID=UPI001962C6D5|nr:hypothetical protein [Glycomyces sp. YM15]
MAAGKRHEAIIKLTKEVPDLLANLLARATGETLPIHDSILPSGEAANLIVPIERISDGVQVLYSDGKAQLAVVFEMQHGKERRKEFDWPYFTAALRLEHQCPTVLVVVTVDPTAAKWARQPIDLGFGLHVMRPAVVCLNEFDPGDDMGFMLLFALKDNPTKAELEELWRAINTLAPELASQYADIVGVGLDGTEAYEIWRELMKIEDFRYQHPYAQELLARGREEGRAEGEAKGEAKAILRVLTARGVAVPDRVAKKILACQDQAQLEHWLDQAAVTNDIERLFSE